MLDDFAPEGGDPLRRPGQRRTRPRARPRRAAIFELGVPVLGICYGEMTMCAQLGGAVEGGHAREFGRAEIRIDRGDARCWPASARSATTSRCG